MRARQAIVTVLRSALFNVVFFVVLVSALTQGWSLPFVARWLGLELPALPAPALAPLGLSETACGRCVSAEGASEAHQAERFRRET